MIADSLRSAQLMISRMICHDVFRIERAVARRPAGARGPGSKLGTPTAGAGRRKCRRLGHGQADAGTGGTRRRHRPAKRRSQLCQADAEAGRCAFSITESLDQRIFLEDHPCAARGSRHER